MANVTTLTGLNQAESVHAGINAAICKISISATTSAGDVLRIGRLPHQAVVFDAVFYPGAAYVDNGIMKCGISGSEAAILASDSYSLAGFGTPNGAGCRMNVSPLLLETSCSDAKPARFTYITCTPTAIVTAGHFGTLVVFYKVPGQTL